MPRTMPLSRRLRAGALVAVASGLVATSCSVIGGGSTYTLQADFSRTVGLYPGSYVRELGIDIGGITKVVNMGDHVRVTMSVRSSYPIAAGAQAVLVADSLLGERYVQFTPAYTGGPRIEPGSVIPIQRTVVPVETDEVLRSLSRVLNTVDPKNVAALVTNLAQVVDGQGTQLNQLVANASGTLDLLAAKSADLSHLTDSLASLTGALRTRTASLSALIRDYDAVSQIVADDRTQVDGTITELNAATGQAAGLLTTNFSGIQDDLGVLATAGRSIDRNLDSIDVGLANAPRLFNAARLAYDPTHTWLPLNSQSSQAASSEVLAARVRDSLASVCRRLAARTPALAPALAKCGDPRSGFFDPILGLIPKVVAGLPNQTTGPSSAATPRGASVSAAGSAPAVPAAPTSAAAPPGSAAPATAVDAFALGLAAIPGLSGAERATIGALPGSASLAPVATGGGVPVLDPGQLLGPPPALSSAPRPHRSLWSRFTSWLGGLL